MQTEIVKILALLTYNPNAPTTVVDEILYAACYGHTEIVKTLAPLIASPDAPKIFGDMYSNLFGSRIWWLYRYGQILGFQVQSPIMQTFEDSANLSTLRNKF